MCLRGIFRAVVRWQTSGITQHGRLRLTAPGLLANLALSLWLPQAWSQTPDERSPLEYEPQHSQFVREEGPAGIRAGSFRIYPSGSLSAGYNSNVFATRIDPAGDAISVGQAVVRADNESDLLGIGSIAFVRARRFPRTPDADTNEYGLAGHFDAALGSRDELLGLLSAQRRFEVRTDIETPGNIPVSYYNEFRGDLTYQHIFNRVTTLMIANARRLQYADPTQQYRNRWSYSGRLQGMYELRSGISLVGIAHYGRDDFQNPSIVVASAETEDALAGVHLSLADLFDFELSGGPFRRVYAGGRGKLTGLSVRGTMLWQPTRITNVRAEVIREDQPTRVLGVLGKVRTDLQLRLGHSYSHHADFHVSARVVLDNYDVVRRTDKTYIAEAGLEFLLARDYELAILYDYASRSSYQYFEGFQRHVASLTLTRRF
jgi:hypothetical protein